MVIPRTIRVLGYLMLIGVFSGCSGSPMVHYYTLSIEAEPGNPSSVTDTQNLVIAVDPISLPEVVDRPQIVLKAGSNRIKLVDEHRWAESLKTEIPRVVAGNLSQLLNTRLVWSYPQHIKGPVDYRVSIDIQRFETTWGTAVAVDALWTVQQPSNDGANRKTGRSTVHQPIRGDGFEDIALAHSLALGTISLEIAEAVRAFPPAAS